MQDGSLSNIYNTLYKKSPESFTVEDVDYLSSLGKIGGGSTFDTTEQDFSTDPIRMVGNLINGFITGFTTLEVGDGPKNALEEVAYSLGHLAGFVGYVPGAGSMGKASGMLLGKVAKSSIPLLSKAGTALEGFKLTSVPMMGANLIGKGFNKYGGAQASAKAIEYLSSKGISQKALMIGEDVISGGLHLGVASAISASPSIPVLGWESNIDARLQALGEGFVAGGVFRSIGNIFPSKGRPIDSKLLDRMKDPDAWKRMLSANLYMGLPSTLNDDPWELQVYQYISGAYFGKGEVSATQRKALGILSEAYKKDGSPIATAQAYQRMLKPESLPGYAEATPEVQNIVREQANFKVGKLVNGLPESTIALYTGFQEGLKDLFENGRISPEKYLENFTTSELAKNYLDAIEKSGKNRDELTLPEMEQILDKARTSTSEVIAREMEVAKLDFQANSHVDEQKVEQAVKLDNYSEAQRVTFTENANLMFDKGIGRFADPINTFANKLSEGDIDKGLEIQRKLIDYTLEAKASDDFYILASKVSEDLKLPVKETGEGRENWNLLRRAWNSSKAKPILQGSFDPTSGKFELLGNRDENGAFIGQSAYPSAIQERLEVYSKEKGIEPIQEVSMRFIKDGSKNIEVVKWLAENLRAGEIESVDKFTESLVENLDSQGYFYRGGQKAKSFAGAMKHIVKTPEEVNDVISRIEKLGYKKPEGATDAYLRNVANNVVLYSEVMNSKSIEEVFAKKDKFINNVAELNKRFQLWEDSSVPVDGKLIAKLMGKEVTDVTEEMQGRQEEVGVGTKTRETGRETGKKVVLADIPRDGDIEGFNGWGEYSKALGKIGYDGLKFVRDDLFNAHTIAGGLDEGIGAIKTVSTHTDKNGQLLLKLADFKATKEMSKAMKEAGIEELVFSTGVKQLGDRTLSRVNWKNGKLGIEGEVITLPYETTKINYSSSEHLDSALKSQYLDTDVQTTPTLTEGFEKTINSGYSKSLRAEALFGDEATKKLYGAYQSAMKAGSDPTSLSAIAKEIDIKKLPTQAVLDVLDGQFKSDNPLFRKLASDLLKEDTELADVRTNMDNIRTEETESEFRDQTQYISAAKRKLLVAKEITPTLLMDKDVRPYWDIVLKNFVMSRHLTPRMPYSSKNVFAPAPFELLSKMGNEWAKHPEWVFLGEGMRKEKIPWIDGKEITIEKAIAEYEKNPNNETMKEKLSWVLGRTPKYHVSGMQVVIPKGFSGIEGTSIVLHPTMLMRQSGADLDIDSGKLYRDIDPDMKKSLWENRERFVTDSGKFLAPDIEDSPFVISNTGKDKDFWKMFDPKSLMLNSANNYTGNALLGVGINASKNIRVMYDIAKRRGSIDGKLNYVDTLAMLRQIASGKYGTEWKNKLSAEHIKKIGELSESLKKGDRIEGTDIKAIVKEAFDSKDMYIQRRPKKSIEDLVIRTYDLIDKAADATGGVTMIDRDAVPKKLLQSAFESPTISFKDSKDNWTNIRNVDFEESPYAYYDYATLSELNKVYKGKDRDGRQYGLKEAVKLVKDESKFLRDIPNMFFQGIQTLKDLKVVQDPRSAIDQKKWREARGYFEDKLKNDKSMRALLSDMGIKAFKVNTKWPTKALEQTERLFGEQARINQELDFIDNDSAIYESLLVLRYLANQGLSRPRVKQIASEALGVKEFWRGREEATKLVTEQAIRDYKAGLENNLERDFFDAVLLSPFYKQTRTTQDIRLRAERLKEATTDPILIKEIDEQAKAEEKTFWHTKVDNQAFSLSSVGDAPIRLLLNARKQLMERINKGLNPSEVNAIVRFADPDFIYEPIKSNPEVRKEEPIDIRKEEKWLEEHLKINNEIRQSKPELSKELRDFADTVRQFVNRFPQVTESFGEQITGALVKSYRDAPASVAGYMTNPEARMLKNAMDVILSKTGEKAELPSNVWRQFMDRLVKSPLALAKDFGYYEIEEQPVVIDGKVELRPVKVWSWTGEKVFNTIGRLHQISQGRVDAEEANRASEEVTKLYKQSEEARDLFEYAFAMRDIRNSNGDDTYVRVFDEKTTTYKNKYENGNKKVKIITEDGTKYVRAKELVAKFDAWMTERARENDINRIRNEKLEAKYLKPAEYGDGYYDLNKVKESIVKAVENGTIELQESIQMLDKIKWQAALDNLQINRNQVAYLLKGLPEFSAWRKMDAEEFDTTMKDNPEYKKYQTNPKLYQERNPELGGLFQLFDATDANKNVRVAEIANLKHRADALDNLAKLPQYADLFAYEGIALLGNKKGESSFETVDHTRYNPHNGHSKQALEEYNKDIMTRLETSRASEAEVWQAQIDAREDFFRGNDVLGALSAEDAEAITRIYGQEWTEKDLHELKVAKTSSLKHRGKEPLPGYDMSPEAWTRYEKGLIENYWKQLSAFTVSEEIREFERKAPMGEQTKYWSAWLWDFARRSYGKPSYFAKDYLDDKGYKLKNSLYYAMSDQVWEKALRKVEKTKLGSKLFDTGIYGKLTEAKLKAADAGIFDNEYLQARYNKANEAGKKLIISEQKDYLRKSLVGQERAAKARALAWFSNFEAKAQMVTLLTHTKTIATNLATGQVNTIVSAGFDPWWKAGDIKWLKDNIFPGWKGKDDLEELVKRHGVIEQMIQYEGGFRNIQLSTNAKDFLNEVVRGNVTNIKEIRNIGQKHGVGKAVVDLASSFMRVPEMALRKRAWMAHYLNAKQMLNASDDIIPNEHPWLIKMANSGVASSQFLYDNIHRPAFASTAIGKIFSRFQTWAWNSVKFRTEAFRQAKELGFDEQSQEFSRLKRMLTADLFMIALAKIYPLSIFDTGTPPPYTYFQDLSDFFFGDEKERDRAFFGQLPYPANILQMVTPPSGRYVITPIVSALDGKMDKFVNYTLWTYFPFGRLARDTWKTIENPRRVIENYTGLPVNKLGNATQESANKEKERNQIVKGIMSRVLFGN